jgi:hypothetical protein
MMLKKKQSQPMLTFEIHDHGHKTRTDNVEGKIKKKQQRKILKKILRHETVN